MKILITGSAGLVGQEAMTFFQEKGWEILAADLSFNKITKVIGDEQIILQIPIRESLPDYQSRVKDIIETTNRITKDNLNERVKLPVNKDELYQLSNGINRLLQRIEDTIVRERQFTSDASHELRTPLASLRGTLEVLIRKPRTQSEYEEKVTYALYEIDRMNNIIEQLLILARMDNNSIKISETMPLKIII